MFVKYKYLPPPRDFINVQYPKPHKAPTMIPMTTSMDLLQLSLNRKAALSVVAKSINISIVQLTVLFRSMGRHIYTVVNTSDTVSKHGFEYWLFGNPSEKILQAT